MSYDVTVSARLMSCVDVVLRPVVDRQLSGIEVGAWRKDRGMLRFSVARFITLVFIIAQVPYSGRD